MELSVLELTKLLIERESVTPEDAGCQQIMANYLQQLGFENEFMNFEDTQNLWSIRQPSDSVLVFAGHTDVVPPGNLNKWKFPPFTPTEHEGYLYGRGAADMKASLAAMLVATKEFVEQHPEHQGSIAFLITSDEEGPFINGTVRVVEELVKRQQPLTWCIVGEPSSTAQLGDVVKIGRRGSLTGQLTIHGQQGHVAYPHLAKNAIHLTLPALIPLIETEWDQGNAYFPPTTFQIANFQGGTGAGNVIPGEASLDFNFRFSTEQTAEVLKEKVTQVIDDLNLEYDMCWKLNGNPFLTDSESELVQAAQEAIHSELGLKTELSTAGGTSDGRFIAPTGCQVVEIGPVNASIHKVNEHVKIDDLDRLKNVYLSCLTRLLTNRK
ncbi:MAG: succinyl-diaminopimelate desuccinylase [Pseudomonadota bacterium]